MHLLVHQQRDIEQPCPKALQDGPDLQGQWLHNSQRERHEAPHGTGAWL